ncbi:RagB/SusD family nutrient uptake outer membrane protein [Porphyromonas pogonae]|uniref:RagB/SusD family nutrient uptake outer membrane protein n=1 Tax=Porphyromonas pogonae TaxID=867595 RepID=UPI002E78EC4A|nr:RagB/SusD family nutrient uptake outer membrane protein [Porphyromonas pogonae]
MNKIKYYFCIIVCVFLNSCGKFTESIPKGYVLPESTVDFTGMIRDPEVTGAAYSIIDISSDNLDIQDDVLNTMVITPNGKAYLWAESYYLLNEADNIWNNSYRDIYQINTVIDNIMASLGGSPEEKEEVMAEAKLSRAYYYWILNQVYSLPYSKAEVAKNLSVPLALKPDLDAKYTRATVKDVIDIIEKDLSIDSKILSQKSNNPYRPKPQALHAMRARFFFYLGEYDKAFDEATKALALNNHINDLRKWSFKDEKKPHSGIQGRPIDIENPENIWFRKTNLADMGAVQCISNDLLALYDSKDLRFKFNFTKLNKIGKEYEDGKFHYVQTYDYSISVPEMMLIQAEVFARRGGHEQEALDILNKLRTFRFKESDYKPLKKNGNQSVLKIVLDERRRELVMRGLRWFDMKRLTKDGTITTPFKRVYQGKEYLLAPGSNRFAFPIAESLRKKNPLIINNPR